MDVSPSLGLPFLMPQQAQKHVTMNEALGRLDAVVQLSVKSATIDSEPGAPAAGDAYILPENKTGAAWSGMQSRSIAVFRDGAWVEIVPKAGWRAWVADNRQLTVFNDTDWRALEMGASAEQSTRTAQSPAFLGVNTDADSTNRLAVKSDAVLLSHDDVTPGSGDIRCALNKATIAGTASAVFQTGFSGRAEIGLSGQDHFGVRVSTDGTIWHDAMTINKDTGSTRLVSKSPYHPALIARSNDDAANWARIDLANANVDTRAILYHDQSGIFVMRNDATAGPIAFFQHQNQRMQIGPVGGVVIGFPAGGDKGPGSLNAQSIYDDNALLSCYVFDQAIDGKINASKWDEKVPANKSERPQHVYMRKFRSRIGSEFDPLTLDGYARHWQQKRHLCSMPNEVGFDVEKGLPAGAWIQRLVETCEIQAVLIETLNLRLKALEALGAN